MARKTTNPRRVGGRDRRARRLRSEGNPCHICGYPIAYGAHYLDPSAFVIDELIPVKFGGSVTAAENTFACHRCCNGWRGTKPLTPQLRAQIKKRYEREVLGRRERTSPVAFETSQKW